MRYLLVALLFVLPSCSLFTDDATPALEAGQAREGIFLRQSSAFEKLINGAAGITPAQKATITAAIAKDREDYKKLAASMHGWLEELGDVDWVAIAKRAYEEWRKTQ